MNALEVVVFLLLAAGGTAVVLVRQPLMQAIVLGFYGLILSVLFVVLQAPDVALSEITIGAVIQPLIIVLTLAKVRGRGAQ